jgi:hypothetical protein
MTYRLRVIIEEEAEDGTYRDIFDEDVDIFDDEEKVNEAAINLVDSHSRSPKLNKEPPPMSKPDRTVSMHNLMMEAGNVTSALHCPPHPIPETEIDLEEAMFLPEFDYTAKHAMEHASAASRIACEMMNRLVGLRDEIHRAIHFPEAAIIDLETVHKRLDLLIRGENK